MTLIRFVLVALILAAVQCPAAAGPNGGGMSASQAGEIARRQTGGGRVLAVRPVNGGYQVKVLTPSGQVVNVFVAGR